MKVVFFTIFVSLLLSGCAGSGRVVQLSDGKIEAPKIIAFDAPSAPWVLEIQSRLKQKGFQVLRWSSTATVTEKTSNRRAKSFNESQSRYVLVIDGHAPYDQANRCFGGGYRFSHLSVDLVDVTTNQTLLNVNGAGYSEGCPPLSGTIFSDIANAVDSAWK